MCKIMTCEEIEFKYRDIPASPQSDDIFGDLLDVGKKKAVGYLPLETIRSYGGVIYELTDWATSKGIEWDIIMTGNTYCGALYFWCGRMLSDFLVKHSEVLLDAGIPVSPYEYVQEIEHKTYISEEFPDAYRIIGLSFNDKRFRDG